MIRAELIRTCTHEKVAEAAVRSIGGAFCERVTLLARACGASCGAFAAQRVRRFSDEACETEWEALATAVRGADAPILVGLRWIVERSLDDERACCGGARRAHGREARL
jgi:hypothetical protein